MLIDVERIVGVIERFVFQHPENHFAVARLRGEGGHGARDALTTIVGTLPGVQVGETVVLEGIWATHRRHGREFRVSRYEPRIPVGAEGIRRYLGSGLIRGVGPVTAARIVEHFGEDALEILESAPDRLEEVAGISRKRGSSIAQAWAEQREIKSLMLFLQDNGVSIGLASRIYRAYGAEALNVVRTDPYRMVRDVRGIGFRTADDLAMQLGLPRDSLARHAAALRHILSQATNEGHSFLPEPELFERGRQLTAPTDQALEAALSALIQSDEAVSDRHNIYLLPLFLAERHAARRLRTMIGPSPLLISQSAEALEQGSRYVDRQGIALSRSQLDAVSTALRHKVCVLTGGPGVGKSTTVRALAQMLAEASVKFCLAAPTGRAAHRLAEATGHSASTLHRLLQYSPAEARFTVNEQNPLPYQFVVADEASMLDIVLFYNLLKALRPNTHLLLVGDADQLPSVGPGNVLRDLVASGVVPVVALHELFRQASQSRIVRTAYQVNEGRPPDLSNRLDGDLFFVREEDPVRAAELVCALVAERLPVRYDFDPRRDIQVISPMHRGELGVGILNDRLQERLNPTSAEHPELSVSGRVFRLGDRVMQVRNDYDRNVYNGDMGVICTVDAEEGALEVSFGDGAAAERARYDLLALEDLVHAYAISVHKSQGCEFPCVVLVLAKQHHKLLQRNLLYTALTRARRLCVIVGSPAAVRLATLNDSITKRYSMLAQRLADEPAS